MNMIGMNMIGIMQWVVTNTGQRQAIRLKIAIRRAKRFFWLIRLIRNERNLSQFDRFRIIRENN